MAVSMSFMKQHAASTLAILILAAAAAAAPFDPDVQVEFVKEDSAVVTWTSEKPAVGKVLVRPVEPGRADPGGGLAGGTGMIRPVKGAATTIFRGKKKGTAHRVLLTGLEPGTRYEVSAQPGQGDRPAEGFVFHTAPAAGRCQVLRLPLALLVFSNVVTKPDAERPGADKPVPSAELERIAREVDAAVLFYFVNSGMRVFLDVDTFVADELFVVEPDRPYGVAFGGGEDEALRAALKKKKKTVTDYDGFLFVSCEKVYRNGAWTYPASGGGTYGPLKPYNAGRCAWKSGGDNSWLFCHEFGHQIDALYDQSGGRGFLFNHFQPWDDTAHCHGEHWDGNAWLLREWAGHVTREQQEGWQHATCGHRYFTCRWGAVIEAADADGDGFPDRDPALPLDEKRFGSSAESTDTDSDGLPDLAEAMACNWVDFGLNEIWAGDPAAHRCDPANPDSDGDGIADGEDGAPLFPAPTEIPRGEPVLDGAIAEGEWPWSAPFSDTAFEGTVHLAWNEDGLFLALEARIPPRSMRVHVDANRDGWYVGRDNVHVTLRPGGGCPGHGAFHVADGGFAEAALHNCGVQGKWPFYDADGLDAAVLDASASPVGTVVELKLLSRLEYGLECRPGERIGLLMAVDPGADSPWSEHRGSLTLFEPHTLCAFTLAR
jgi:hypothetical protein